MIFPLIKCSLFGVYFNYFKILFIKWSWRLIINISLKVILIILTLYNRWTIDNILSLHLFYVHEQYIFNGLNQNDNFINFCYVSRLLEVCKVIQLKRKKTRGWSNANMIRFIYWFIWLISSDQKSIEPNELSLLAFDFNWITTKPR